MVHFLVTGPDGSAPCGQASPGATLSSDNPNHRPAAYRDRLVAHMLHPVLERPSAPRLWEVSMRGPDRLDPFRDSSPSAEVLGESLGDEPTDIQRFTFAALLTLNYSDNPVVVRWLLGYLSGEDRSEREADAVHEKVRLMRMMDTGCSPYMSSVQPLLSGVLRGDLRGGAAASAHRMAHDAPPGLDLAGFAAFACNSSPERCAEVAASAVRPCTSWRL